MFTICTSGFVDDVMFAITGPMAAWRYRSSLTATLCTGWHPCCVVFIASCLRRRRAPRLDESLVHGVPGRSMPCTIALCVCVFVCVCVCVCLHS